jgi:hypothetical protein
MADTLSTIHMMTMDSDFRGRLNAGAAKENAPGNPVSWTESNCYAIASAPTWAEKVDYWIASNPGADPANGWALNQAVITDGDITARIKQMVEQVVP